MSWRRLGTLLLLCLCLLGATSNQYVNPGTVITFGDSAQTPTYTLTLTALAAGTGQYSARADLGATVHSPFYVVRCTVALTGTNVVGSAVEVWLGTSDGTNADGQLGTTTAALATDKRNNLTPVGQIIVDQTTTNVAMTGSWNVYVPTRYATLALWNATALPLQTSTSAHHCEMTETPFQQQGS